MPCCLQRQGVGSGRRAQESVSVPARAVGGRGQRAAFVSAVGSCGREELQIVWVDMRAIRGLWRRAQVAETLGCSVWRIIVRAGQVVAG